MFFQVIEMLRGIVLSNGVIDAKGLDKGSLLKDNNVVVLVDEAKREIYVWVGSKSSPRDRFMAARLADRLRWKLFGGASPVIQDSDKAEAALDSYGEVTENIPKDLIADILGL